jgi:ribosomal protein S27AE
MADERLGERVRDLEERLETVEDTLERYRKRHALLLTDANVDALDAPSCPECGDGALTKSSGLSWAKAVCGECGSTWVLSG